MLLAMSIGIHRHKGRIKFIHRLIFSSFAFSDTLSDMVGMVWEGKGVALVA